jgi:MFS family permease
MDRPPLSPRDRRALIATAGQFFVNGAMTASFVARAPQIRDRIGVTVDEFGLLLTIAAVFGVIGSFSAGRIVHAASTRRVLQAGAIVMVLCLPTIGAATTPALWLVGMLAYAFVDVLVDVSMNLQGSWISARRHTPVMNRLHGLWSLGTFAGGLGAVAANAAGLSPFTHLSIVAGLMAITLAFVTRDLLTDDEEGHGEGALQVPPPGAPRRTRLAPVILLVFAAMFAVTAEVTGGDWATFRLTDDFGATAALASVAFVAYTVGMTATRLGGDWLQHRFGRMSLHRLSVAVATVGLVVASLVPNEAAAVVGFILVGVGVATFLPKVYDDAARAPGRRGAGLGAMTAGIRVAHLVTPVAVGALAESLSVGAAIAIVTLPAMLGLVLVTEANERLLRRRVAARTAA